MKWGEMEEGERRVHLEPWHLSSQDGWIPVCPQEALNQFLFFFAFVCRFCFPYEAAMSFLTFLSLFAVILMQELVSGYVGLGGWLGLNATTLLTILALHNLVLHPANCKTPKSSFKKRVESVTSLPAQVNHTLCTVACRCMSSLCSPSRLSFEVLLICQQYSKDWKHSLHMKGSIDNSFKGF